MSTQLATTPTAGVGHNSDPTKIAETELAQKIKAEYKLVVDAAKNVVHRAKKFGEMLYETKGKIGHGDWLDWLRDHCDLPKRTAQRYFDLGKPTNKCRLEEALRKMTPEERENLTLAKAIALARGDNPDRTDPNASDRYDNSKKALIKKLQDLSVEQAEAAVSETTNELRTVLAAMKETK